MPPNKLQYRNYKQLKANSFIQDIEQLPEKNWLYSMGKKIL